MSLPASSMHCMRCVVCFPGRNPFLFPRCSLRPPPPPRMRCHRHRGSEASEAAAAAAAAWTTVGGGHVSRPACPRCMSDGQRVFVSARDTCQSCRGRAAPHFAASPRPVARPRLATIRRRHHHRAKNRPLDTAPSSLSICALHTQYPDNDRTVHLQEHGKLTSVGIPNGLGSIPG